MPEDTILESDVSRDDYRTNSVILDRQHVYILPTREGFVLSIVLLTMLLGAINYNNNMAYMLTFLLGSVLMLGILHTYRNIAGLVISAGIPSPVFAGESAEFPLIIDNRNGIARTSVMLVCKTAKSRRITSIPVITDVPADHWHHICISKPDSKRGVMLLGRIVFSCKYPFGLFRAWSNIDIDRSCVIYPKPYGLKQLPDPVITNDQGQSGSKSGLDDFAGFRHYHPGDSIRNIAWKALAREQPLLVKRFSGDGSQTLMLTWNNVDYLPETELRLSQLCLWVIQAEQEGWTYGLEIPEVTIEPARGILHRNRCLENLAKFGSGK